MEESWYNADVVDIALIELNDDSAGFDSYMPVHTGRVKLVDDLLVIRRRAIDFPKQYTECLEKSNVATMFGSNTALILSTHTEAGMAGCGVGTRPLALRVVSGNEFALVGVFVPKADSTAAVEPLSSLGPRSKTRKAEAMEEIDEVMMAVNCNIGDRGSYCLICEIPRVDSLLDMLST